MLTWRWGRQSARPRLVSARLGLAWLALAYTSLKAVVRHAHPIPWETHT